MYIKNIFLILLYLISVHKNVEKKNQQKYINRDSHVLVTNPLSQTASKIGVIVGGASLIVPNLQTK